MRIAHRNLIVLAVAVMIFVASSFVPSSSPAADAELKHGDTIGPNNWQR
ncbi:MAG: hypothetical protein HW373_773, partial [Deltaproteobacteria bacterium]|nr:hypothetical protein [Deltaproteobacteria bacterium]